MFSIQFVTQTGCKRDDRIPSLISIEGRYVNSQRVYINGKFAGLVIVSKKYDSLLRNYYHQSFALSEGEWKSLPLEKNTLAAAQAAFH